MDIQVFRDNLRQQLHEKRITLSALSVKADLSEDTLRSVIYGKSQDIKLSTIVKIADVLDVSIDDLISREYYTAVDMDVIRRIHRLPERSVNMIRTYMEWQEQMLVKQTEEGKMLIPLVSPFGSMRDGMYLFGEKKEELDISQFPEEIQKMADFSIRIMSDFYSPRYFINDILICSSKQRPEANDVAIYVDKENRFYIRKYYATHLESLDGYGERILESRFQDFTLKGVVISSVSQFDVEQYR